MYVQERYPTTSRTTGVSVLIRVVSSRFRWVWSWLGVLVPFIIYKEQNLETLTSPNQVSSLMYTLTLYVANRFGWKVVWLFLFKIIVFYICYILVFFLFVYGYF